LREQVTDLQAELVDVGGPARAPQGGAGSVEYIARFKDLLSLGRSWTFLPARTGHDGDRAEGW
jgi:hypothetical protein